MSKTGASPEFERKMQEIAEKTAHMVIPRSKVQTPLTEPRFPAWTEDEGAPMNERDELAHLLFITDNRNAADVEAEWRAAGGRQLMHIYDMADALIAAGYRKPERKPQPDADGFYSASYVAPRIVQPAPGTTL